VLAALAFRVRVTAEQYIEALGFTLWTFKAGKIGLRDLYKKSKRAYGEFMEHVIRGKIAELAFENFMRDEELAELITEVDLPVFLEGKYLPDVLAFNEAGVWKVPKFWIDVKAEQEGHKWMLIRKSSLAEGGRAKSHRPYDAYVGVLVKLPPDHAARLLKQVPSIKKRMSREVMDELADLRQVEAHILGYARLSDFTDVIEAEGGSAPARRRLDRAFGRRGGMLVREGRRLGGTVMGTDNCAIALADLRSDWEAFPKLLRSPGLSSDARLLAQKSLQRQMNGALKELRKEGQRSWFGRRLPKPLT
jgi:hypothetical protein